MSSLRNAVPRREHRERHQPTFRRKKGLLEKKKDYRLRAKDFHSKERRIKKLKEKARLKNPDEFYFGMDSSYKKDGVFHKRDKDSKYTPKELLDMKTQDIGYLEYKKDIESKKVAKLERSVSYFGSVPAENLRKKHVVFVDNVCSIGDNEKEEKKFNEEEYFDTPRNLLSNAYNRPHKNNIESIIFSKKLIKRKEKSRKRKHDELESRKNREAELKKSLTNLHVQKQLMGKGTVMKRKKRDKDGNVTKPVYQWKKQRKR